MPRYTNTCLGTSGRSSAIRISDFAAPEGPRLARFLGKINQRTTDVAKHVVGLDSTFDIV